jgi:hypothetical protein
LLALIVCSRSNDRKFDDEREAYSDEELEKAFGPNKDGFVVALEGAARSDEKLMEFDRKLIDRQVRQVMRRDGSVKWVDREDWEVCKLGRLKVGKGNDGKAMAFVQKDSDEEVRVCERRKGRSGKICGGDVLDGLCLRCGLPFESDSGEV